MTLSVAMIFGNNMVLQRNKKIVVWGEAESGSSITVKLNGVTASVTAVEGKWKAELPPMEACTGCEMHIEDDKGQSIELKNVAIERYGLLADSQIWRWGCTRTRILKRRKRGQ